MPEGVGTPNVDLVELIKVLPILLISPFGPTISAFLMTFSSNGKVGIKQLWSRFWNRDISKIWLVILFLFYPTYFLTLRLLGYLSGIPQPTPVGYSNPLLILFAFLPSLLHGGLSEEFGWRGYALPRLQAHFSAFWASLILGVIEGLWHYPLIIMPQDSRFGMSLITLIIWQTLATYYRTWIFNNTNGSILAAVLFHAAGNTSELIVPVNVFRIPWLPEDPYVPSIMIIVGIIFVAGILLVSNRRDMITVLSRGEQVEKIG